MLLIRGLLLLVISVSSELAIADPVTIYRPKEGGLGYLVRNMLSIDGVPRVNIKGGEKITFDLPKGKHTFKFLATRFTFDVTGPHLLRISAGFAEVYIVEVLPDVDAEINTEFSEMIDVPPI